MIKAEDIYNKTNDGLEIIFYYYPQAREAHEHNTKFKMRDERTPSAALKKIGNVWKVTDFGGEGRAMGPVDICMQEDGLTFTEALLRLADRYGVENNLSRSWNKPDIRKVAAGGDDEEGAIKFDLNDSFTEKELEIFGPKVTNEVLSKYKWHSVKSFTRTKNRENIVISSNENYPIFMRDEGEFKKIYQPLNPEKSNRFYYTGKIPAEYINGFSQLAKRYEEYNASLERDFRNSGNNEEKPFTFEKLPEAVICSGERDAMCVAALGYFPLWFNSETYNLSEKEFKRISQYAEIIYNIPDIDKTGVERGIKLSLEYLDIHTIWLPDWLKTYKDMRGNPRKDFRDYTELRPGVRNLKNLINLAMPMRFWEVKKDDKGRARYEINTEFVYHFLRCNGFYALEDKNEKTGKMFIKIDNHIVKPVLPKDMRLFLRNFMRDRFMTTDLRNLVNNSNRLSESALEALDEIELDFTDYTDDSQFFFFPNNTWRITAERIEEFKSTAIDRYVWSEEVVPYRVKRKTPAFKITAHPEMDLYDIDILDKSSHFFSYLTNASRVHWRKELETEVDKFPTLEQQEEYRRVNKFEIAGPLLSDEEQEEQKRHLVNKIFAIGYLLHRYKSDSRAWCVFAMDNKIGTLDESNGRSGKSFCFKTIRRFMKSVTLSGRNKKLTDNPHIYDRVTEYTDFVLIDDGNAYLDFDFFFDVVTGDMSVNPKNNRSYEIPFEKAPKFCITSNYTLRRVDPSTEGRILYTVFSDYYHQKTADNDYRETRSIYDDFGKNLLRDYSDDEWNDDINFFADCCQFYLSMIRQPVKIQPPMGNVVARNLITQMGNEGFLSWADVYFTPDGDHVDAMVSKNAAFEDCMQTMQVRMWTKQTFTKSLKAYCRYAEHIVELDPPEYKNGQGRIIRKQNGASTEMIYVRTKALDPSYINTDCLAEEDKPF